MFGFCKNKVQIGIFYKYFISIVLISTILQTLSSLSGIYECRNLDPKATAYVDNIVALPVQYYNNTTLGHL